MNALHVLTAVVSVKHVQISSLCHTSVFLSNFRSVIFVRFVNEVFIREIIVPGLTLVSRTQTQPADHFNTKCPMLGAVCARLLQI